MKRLALASLALLPLMLAQASDAVTFVGSFMERGTVAVRFDESVPAGQKRTMELPEHQVVEMAVDTSGKPTVRLLDPSGKELHAAAGSPGRVDFVYALCRGGTFAYSSPPPKAGKPVCP
ncbi:hypothetical protein [Lysobacter claricitrinus]|uniref:hypothetical protein n=1 Tax=Lysobacter claricitrinus TaxID=3367728 RepID=UPI0037DABD69